MVPIENTEFSVVQTIEKIDSYNVKENSSPYFARGFRIPRGSVPKRAPKPKNAGKSAPKGGHNKNQREGNREKHEKGDARRQKEQKKAEEKREKNKKKKH